MPIKINDNSKCDEKASLAFFTLILLVTIVSCSSQKSTSSFSAKKSIRNESSFETAIIVKSVKEEYEWVKNHYPDWQFARQALSEHKRKTPKKSIYFDLSNFFGKRILKKKLIL